VQDAAQGVAGHRPKDDVDVIGHHDPRVQFVPLALKERNGASDQAGEARLAEVTDAVTGIEVSVHAIRIPAKEFFLLMPGERAFRSHRLLEDDVALLFEPEQEIRRQRASLTERDEIRAAFFLEMGENAAEMETADEGVRWFL
jgi:hypothetical protein